jgi:hypothetical protein
MAVKLASTSPYNTQMGKQAFYKQTRQPELASKYATAQECVYSFQLAQCRADHPQCRAAAVALIT